ncbi:hypothetical protein [Hyalangium gracile]|uniref:hypothetical protein n=1 Tax=Hyalangium gracile TaxID=394092 RepID=UPI001CD03656|nr:hypothetical protein [Hyalangium gracile]
MKRFFLGAALGLFSTMVIGCGGGTEGDTDNDPPAGNPPQSETIAWAGTWDAALQYGVRCDHGFGNIKTANYTTQFTVALTGQNSALEAQTDVNYYMGGTGSNAKLDLSGTFPLKGSDNQKASTREDETDLSIKLTTVTDKNKASGTISGTFRSGFGANCSVENGTVTFTRN